MHKRLLKLSAGLLLISNFSFSDSTPNLVLSSEVKWTHLNPKRGDLAPKAGTLWGDRNGPGPTGYLLKPNDGFQSPPHIHNVSYRAIVINGEIHNDDPNAKHMWMTPGAFWTQPKGEVHITASRGKNALAYIEIENGPYLVFPAKTAFDSGERPVNVTKENIVWLDADTSNWIDHKAKGVQISYLWGVTSDNNLNGSFIKLPSSFKGKIVSNSDTFKAIVIKGPPNYQNNQSKRVILETGSYFGSNKNKTTHKIDSRDGHETLLYIRTKGSYTVTSN
ncbi:MAG: DUF4437 domain-containing protein [Candidatus Cloacimonetes bacterium]|nr:DUF4437 domain-containing protein [Candidatus Cloacimonadota bacterium]